MPISTYDSYGISFLDFTNKNIRRTIRKSQVWIIAQSSLINIYIYF